MSAFIVGKEHVDALVAVAVQGPADQRGSWYGVNDPDTGDPLTFEDADRIGTELWAECYRSVEYRYEDSANEGLPGPIGLTFEDVTGYTFPAIRSMLDAVAAIKAAHCLRYQSCEHPGWEASWSRRFLTELVDDLTRHVPGYAEADWEVTAQV